MRLNPFGPNNKPRDKNPKMGEMLNFLQRGVFSAVVDRRRSVSDLGPFMNWTRPLIASVVMESGDWVVKVPPPRGIWRKRFDGSLDFGRLMEMTFCLRTLLLEMMNDFLVGECKDAFEK
jgi:hypothetical protein